MRYNVVIKKDEDGMFVAEVPSLPWCISQGLTFTEAINNIKESALDYIESLREHGEQIPPSDADELPE